MQTEGKKALPCLTKTTSLLAFSGRQGKEKKKSCKGKTPKGHSKEERLWLEHNQCSSYLHLACFLSIK